MAKEEPFEFKNPFMARTSEPEFKVNKERINELFTDYDPETLTGRVILNGLLDMACMKVRKSSEPRPEDTATIQNLNNEIGRFKIERDFLKDKNGRLESMYTDTNRTALVLQEEVRTLQAAPVIGENDVLVQLSPLFKLVLKLEAASLKKKTGKDYTTQDILIEAYKEIGITGGRNIPFRQWSAADYKKVESTLNTPVAQ